MIPRLHVVTDDSVLGRRDFAEGAVAVIESGGPSLALHLRGPGTPGGRLFHVAAELRPAAEAHGTLLVVNDRVDVALATELTAVHLGARSLPLAEALRLLGPGARVGASVHGAPAAVAAVAEGSAWLFVGTLYATPSHPDRRGTGAGLLEEVAAAVHDLRGSRRPGTAAIPMLGIGGVSLERVPEVRRAGAHGVAVIRGVWDAPDPARAVGDYLDALT